MFCEPERHHRRSIRLKGYDYSRAGAYFVSVCTHDRICLLGDVISGVVQLSPIGTAALECWMKIPQHFADVELDEFIIMPNHVHGIIFIQNDDVHTNVQNVGVQYIEPLQRISLQNESRRDEPKQHQYQHVISRSIGSIIRSYKSAVTRWCKQHRYEHFRWQRNYYERIIRNERELYEVRKYIINNPMKWELDEENPRNGR